MGYYIKKRIEFIDALRGFTMILVVMGHVCLFCDIGSGNIAIQFWSLFRMPLFFFISGFIVYKDRFIWNASNTISFLVKKFRVQIITTIIVLFVCSLTKANGLSFLDCLQRNDKGGYWFTIILFC